jgi:hypothetical protein
MQSDFRQNISILKGKFVAKDVQGIDSYITDKNGSKLMRVSSPLHA